MRVLLATVAPLLLTALLGSSPPDAGSSAQRTVLRPAVGLVGAPLGESRDAIRESFGAPEVVISESVWEYPGRCATLTFDESGRLLMAALGRPGKPEEAIETCEHAEIEGGLKLGDGVDEAERLFPSAKPLEGPRSGGTVLRDSEKALVMRFQGGLLYFASTQLPAAKKGRREP